MASTPGPVMEFLGRVAYELTTMRPMLPTYLHLLLSAIFPIYAAAHAALARPSSAAKPEKTKKTGSANSDDGEFVNKVESLAPSDALLFPLLAGVTLTSLFFLLKWLEDPAWLNYILGIYFSWVGLFFAANFLKDALGLIRSVCLPKQYSAHGKVWEYTPYSKRDHFRATGTRPGVLKEYSPLPGFFRKLPLPNFLSKITWKLRRAAYLKAKVHLHIHRIVTVKTSIDCVDVISFVASAAIAYYHSFVDKPWYLTNFFGFAFCYGSLQLISPTTAWTGTLLLSALFCYDIYMVFFTPMMVAVATKLDVPIKLLFPRPDGCILPVGAVEASAAMEEYLQCLAKKRTMAMLGLGDIVIPGLMLTFALRFDLFLYYLKQGKSEKEVKQEKPVYLTATGSWGERLWTSTSNQSAELRAKSFPKPYFQATVIGYLIGLATTVIVMQIAEHAQPALLYLCPGVLISLWGTALVRDELKLLWTYNEDIENQEETKKKEEQEKLEKDSKQDFKTVESNGHLKEAETPNTKAPAEEDSGKEKENRQDHPIPERSSDMKAVELNGEVYPLQDRAAKDERILDRNVEKDNKPSDKKADAETKCRTYFTFSLTKPDNPTLVPVIRRKSKSIIAAEIQREQDFAAKIPSKPSSSSASVQPSPAISIRSSRSTQVDTTSEDDVLPDVAADKAVIAKLRKEVTASSAGTVDVGGGEPPEKRRRKG